MIRLSRTPDNFATRDFAHDQLRGERRAAHAAQTRDARPSSLLREIARRTDKR